MQRYHAANCNSAVNNGALGGRPARDISRAESFLVPPSSYLNLRRSSQTPYNLRCDKEQLNPRIGPPDFHPQTPNCPEETLNREYVQSGYRDTVEGLEETREISLSQVQAFTRPSILKCKEAIRKCHRAINETRAQKRKAGQVYGVPLSGTLIIKPGIFPDQRPCSEDFRKKWIEGLSQRHKRLRSLADHVPHGYRRKSLFEVLIRNNVPLLRATWFIKVTYLNQVQPGTSGISLGVHDKIQFSRSEQWTKDIIEYLQYLLDEFVTRNNSHATLHITNQSPQMVCAGLMGQKREPLSAIIDGEEPSLYSKWWYVVRIIQWHHAEGLLIPSLVIDWVLRQLQEKELLIVLQLLVPIIYGVIQSLVLSQSYVRNLVGIAVRFIQETSPGGSDLVDNSRRTYTSSALVEMLRYLILAVPDTFVALDCIQLPSSVVNDRIFLSKVAEDARRAKDGPIVVTGALRGKGYEVQAKPVSVDCVFSSIQKCAGTLARAARRDHPGHNVAKALQALDKALMHGDVRVAYALLFENIWDEAVHECWIAEVSPCLRSLLKHIDTVPASLICSTFFICEWATCDFRDFRAAPPHDLKFTGRKDFSQIYIAIRLLKLKMSDMQKSNILKRKNKDIFESPSPLHDIIVCWIDQHEVHNGEGFKCLQLLIREFMLAGLFYPQAYVRQLFVSGIMDSNGPMVDLERQKRHYKILKQLPGPYICDVLEEAQIAELPVVREAMIVYSNDRRLTLRGLLGHNGTPGANSSNQKQKHPGNSGGESASSSTVGQWYFQSKTNSSFKNPEMDIKLEELKALISVLLRLPNSSLLTKSGLNGSQGSFKSWVNDGTDVSEEGSGCEKCRRVKRQRLWEEQSFYLSPIPADEEETWWSRKGPKSVESFKVDPPPKPAKQVSRGRQKTVRKTQSLAQLAASRIEGSEGASTNYMCESRLSCSHHRTSLEDVSKSGDGIRSPHSGDIVSIGKVLKRMQLVDKRTVTVWLISVVKQLVEEAEKTAVKVGQYGRSILDVDNQSPGRWKLGEDELSAILYMMDISNELLLAIRFLIWLLPKVPSSPGVTIHGGRNILIPPRNVENHACEVREAFLLSCIQRYENIIVAADLIPEVLSASMHRSAAVMASSDRLSSSPILVFSHYLLKKYKNVASVVEWENTFKSTSDRRLTSELDSGRSQEGDLGFPLGVPAGVGDPDDYFRQKIAGVRVSRVGLSMKDVVQRHVDEAFHSFFGKDRKVFGPGTNKTGILEKWDDYYQIARQIVMGLMDCMRQTGGAAQEGDPSLVSSAIAAIIYNVGQVIAKIPDLATSNNQLNIPSPSSSLHFSQHILRIHITCLSILKEALGERQSRVFEVALAAEASSALVQASTPGKASRGQFHPSPESHYSNANLSNGILNNSTEAVLGKAEKIRAAVSALVIGTVLQGVASLERMVTLFRLKEGLDLIQYVRSMKSNANGNARSMGLKVDNLVEVSVNWFRVLVGNCRTVCEGFIVELLGEASIIALSRMQQTLPLNLVFPPAYSILAFVIWRPFIFNASAVVREDIHQLYQSMALAIGDSIKHLPFRAVCLRNTYGLYDLIAADTLDSEFASILESNGANMHAKAAAFFPLRARLFLDALVDCRIPEPLVKQDDGSWMSGHVEPKLQCAENMKTFLDKLVGVLDTLQPARFHWQWVELRLLLNEQAIIKKLENHDISLNEAIRSLSPNPDKFGASESESNFIEIILTRLLVRPDAAPLFSEVVHLLGRSLEDSMLLQAKWFLRGQDVLYGRKSILQRLINIAESKGLATKTQFWKPWGWCHSSTSPRTKGERWKSEATSLEEGEVADEGIDFKHVMKGSAQLLDVEGFNVSKQHVTERALIELVLPCVDQGSDDSRNTFASEMIKQMNNIEYQINLVNCGACKPAATPSSGIDSPSNKSNSRKGVKGGSPGLARRSTGSADAMPPSPSALLVSLALRLQFLLRLLPIVRADRESPLRNMRYMLASVVLRLLGSRVVYEDASHFVDPTLILSKRGGKSPTKTSAFLCGESLFDCLLLVLHALLSSYLASWLKSKFDSKSTKYSNDFAVFDHEVAESLQNDLDRMILPETIRWRIQTAMPILFPSIRHSISCQPPSVSPAALSFLQPSNLITISNPSTSTLPQRNQASLIRLTTNVKTKPLPVDQDPGLEIDPWIILEDGARSGQPSSNSAVNGSTDRANVKASNWLKGAIRVRRTDLTYIGSMDEDS